MRHSNEEIMAAFRYDAESGSFLRTSGPKAGRPAGSKSKRLGYVFLTIGPAFYLAHRVAWLIQTGAWPKNQVDHKNCDRADNRWANLREATQSQQQMNSKKRHAGLYKGVYPHGKQSWRSRIRIDGKDCCLGTFPTPELARTAYAAAAMQHFGEFARVE